MNAAVVAGIYEEIAEYKREIDEAQSKITGLRAELYRLKRKGVDVQTPSAPAQQKTEAPKSFAEREAEWHKNNKPKDKPALLLSEMPTFLREQVEAELAVDEDKGPA